MSDIKKQLDAVINSELEALNDIEVGTEEYKTTVDGISKLLDKSIELRKTENDIKYKKREYELKSREIKLNEERFDFEYDKNREENLHRQKVQRVQNWLTVAGIAIPTMLTIWGTYKTFEFEKTGNITTIMGRGFINKLIPKK